MAKKRRPGRSGVRTSWDPLARWYDGWVGKDGSKHHRQLAIPAVLELLEPKQGEQVLDIGAGQGVLAPFITQAGAQYTGVDVSAELLRLARQHHGQRGRFIQGDARNLDALPELKQAEFDAVVFLLSVQDMDPLDPVLRSAAWALKAGGRAVLLMTHPCFRVPRQSGWGWDEGRKLQYRRVDRYLTPLSVPLKAYPGQQSGVTLSFHRPLQAYVNGLAECGLLLDGMKEIPTYKVQKSGPRARAKNLANREIPLFLGLRAVKRMKTADDFGTGT
ncbi:MAG: class I SAM-dependent methyltransferase [Anaerolineae bacterium]|nr:MAG: class I SAM-dependent methyltransferase [Anaerolineae bacterium]